MLRRLTALLASLVLLPSTIVGGRPDCVMGERGTAAAAHHGAGAGAHGAHHALPHAVSHDAPDHAPADVPHAPAECISVAACGVAVVLAQTVLFDTPDQTTDRVAADAALAPESPAPGLEPPPPRA